MASLVIKFKLAWTKIQTDLSKCYCCEDQIFSNMWVIEISANDRIIHEQVGGIKVCDSCKSLMDKNEN